MKIQKRRAPAAVLANEIERAASFADLDAAIERFSNAAAYQIVHFAICGIDNSVFKDIIFTRPVTGKGISPSYFSDELRNRVVNEARSLLAPFDLLSHEFQTCDNRHFDQLREKLNVVGLDGVFVAPYCHENTISIIIIHCRPEEFTANMSAILYSLYLLASKAFARFPTLAKWPSDYRLTERESEILQISSMGAFEKDVAGKLGISTHTVRIHIENAKRKLQARSKSHAVVIATGLGEINPMSDQLRRS